MKQQRKKNEEQIFVRHCDTVNRPQTLTLGADLHTTTGHELLQQVQKIHPAVVGFVYGGVVLNLNFPLAQHHVASESTLFTLFDIKRT